MAVHIAGVGARTSVGLYAGACAASVRAAISGIEMSDLVDRVGDPVRFALDKNLDSALMGPQRLVALAWAAAAEIFDQSNSQPLPPMPVFIGLPEHRPGWSVADSNTFQVELHRRLESLFPVEQIQVLPKGHASGLLALDAGCKLLESGRAEFCLVGGVDSYYHGDTIAWLLDTYQLLSILAGSFQVKRPDSCCWLRGMP